MMSGGCTVMITSCKTGADVPPGPAKGLSYQLDKPVTAPVKRTFLHNEETGVIYTTDSQGLPVLVVQPYFADPDDHLGGGRGYQNYAVTWVKGVRVQ